MWVDVFRHLTRQALAMMRMSVFDMASGRGVWLWYAACPSSVEVDGFLGKQTRIAALNSG